MRKKDREAIERLQESIDVLQRTLDPSTINKANKCDELQKNISEIKLKVKKANVRISDTGIPYIDVLYVTNAKVFINEDLSTKSDPRFRAIALLSLVSNEDVQKLRDAIEHAREFAKKLK